MDKEIRLRIPQDLYSRIVGYAEKADISKNQAMKEILEFHFMSDDYSRVQKEYNQMIQDVSQVIEENSRIMADVTDLMLDIRRRLK